jgi:hypothetical protein
MWAGELIKMYLHTDQAWRYLQLTRQLDGCWDTPIELKSKYPEKIIAISGAPRSIRVLGISGRQYNIQGQRMEKLHPLTNFTRPAKLHLDITRTNNQAVREVTTEFLEIHGLPPIWVHTGNDIYFRTPLPPQVIQELYSTLATERLLRTPTFRYLPGGI